MYDIVTTQVHGYWLYDWRDNCKFNLTRRVLFLPIIIRTLSCEYCTEATVVDADVPLLAVDVAHHGLRVNRTDPSNPWAAWLMAKVKVGSRYYVFNLLSELDQDGEYFLSRSGTSKGMLYFQPPARTWPPAPGSTALAGAFVSSAANLVVLQSGTKYVSFQGISWQHARSTVITSASATVSHITIHGCTVANAGGGGIDLVGFHNVVRSNKVFNLGGTGVSIKGGLHRSLTRGDNLVTNNEIHHVRALQALGTPPTMQRDQLISI
jgi:hypothetical protein